MPTIKKAVEVGPLTKAEEKVLDIINSHPSNIWSSTLDDLEELARWARWPNHSIALARSDISELDTEVLTINSHVQIRPDPKKEPLDTYTLRTVLAALNNLHDTGRIACYSLHKRNYYGKKDMSHLIEKEIETLGPEGKEQAAFSVLTPEQRRAKESSRRRSINLANETNLNH